MKNQNKNSRDVAKATVNHDDTMRVTLLRALLVLLVEEGEISADTAGTVETNMSLVDPFGFKKLMNEGVAAYKNPYYSQIAKALLSPAAAIRIGALFAKFPTEGDALLTKNAALKTYIESELAVLEFDTTKLDALISTPIFFKVRAEFRRLFSEFSPKEVIDNIRFGPGVTSTPDIKRLSQKHAWLLRNNGVVLPKDLYDYFHNRGLSAAVARSSKNISEDIVHLKERGYSAPSMLVSHTNVVETITTVKKDATTDRTISTFPVGSTLISVALNSALASVIHGADRRVEFVYQDKCSGFLDDAIMEDGMESTATLDLKDASGHVSWRLLTHLIDNSDLLELLRALRAEFSRFTVFVRKPKDTSTTHILLHSEVSKAKSPTYTKFLGIEEQTEKFSVSETEKWNYIVQQTEWLQKLVLADSIPYFYEIEEVKDGYIATVDMLRYSHAGMGSGATFPMMAALIAAILRALKVDNFRVFGDDIVLTKTSLKEVSTVIQTLTQFGYVINYQKSCTGDNPIREAVGSWWQRVSTEAVKRFQPFYLRMDISSLSNPAPVVTVREDGTLKSVPGKCHDLRIIHYAVMMHNYAEQLYALYNNKRSLQASLVCTDDSIARKISPIAEVLARMIAKNSAVPVVRVPESSGLFGLKVPDSSIWLWYHPVFKDGVLSSLRQRLTPGVPSFVNGSIMVERLDDVRADHGLQVLYIKVKGITTAVFDKPSPSSFVDRDAQALTCSFVQDPFFSALGVYSGEIGSADFCEWVCKVNNILSTSVDRKSSDRPPKDEELYHQVTSRLEIPLHVIIAWESQDQAT